MKKRVNLFSKKKQQQPIPVAAFAIRNYGLLFMCICIIFTVIAGGWYFYQLQKLSRLEADLRRLQTTQAANGQIQGNIVFFVNKKEQLKKFLKDDAHFEVYYDVLNNAIEQSHTGASMVSFSINIARDSTFIIGFSNFNDSQKLLDYIETSTFLDNFDHLILRQFAILNTLPGQENATSFQLTFSAKFKEVTGGKN